MHLVLAESSSERRPPSYWRRLCSYGNVAGKCDRFSTTFDAQCSTHPDTQTDRPHVHTHIHRHSPDRQTDRHPTHVS